MPRLLRWLFPVAPAAAQDANYVPHNVADPTWADGAGTGWDTATFDSEGRAVHVPGEVLDHRFEMGSSRRVIVSLPILISIPAALIATAAIRGGGVGYRRTLRLVHQSDN